MVVSHRKAFAANLARLCAGERSIAAVCRSTSINRQQFNRYLAGRSLPNQRNLDKICRHFGIDEHDLFKAGNGVPAESGDGESAWSHPDVRAALKLIYSTGPSSITPGRYFAYFAVPWEKDSIMRSALVVRRDGNLTTFRRLTGIAERKRSWWSHYIGDHKGIVVERRHWAYLIALNSRGNREPSLIALRWLTNTSPMLSGHAMVMGPPGPVVTAVVVSPADPTLSLRQIVRRSHVYALDDPSIEPIVLDALDEQRRALATRLRYLDLSVEMLT